MSKKEIKLQQLKVESFVTEIKGDKAETIHGATTWGITAATATLAESIHELGDYVSWWHCDTGGGNAGSEVVIGTPDGDACLLNEAVVNG